MRTTSLCSKMHALDMIVISNLGPLQPLELPTNMNYLLTSLKTHILRTPPSQVPPKVALTCQLRNSTRSTLPTLIGLLMSPFFLLETYHYPPPPTPPPPPPPGRPNPTRSNTDEIDPKPEDHPLKLPLVIQHPPPPQNLIWTTLSPVKPSPLMTASMSTSWIPIPPPTLSIKPTSIMCLNTLLPIMDVLLIGEPIVALLDLM